VPAPAARIVETPSKKPKPVRGSKDARAAKAAKKAAKKAVRQAERKARAKNNNKAAIRAVAAAAAAKARQVEATPASTPARTNGVKRVAAAVPTENRRTSSRPPAGRTTGGSAVGTGGAVRTIGMPLMILLAAVIILGALGWFLAARH
jgi:hypothetical protein